MLPLILHESNEAKNGIDAFDMCCQWRILWIRYMCHVTNAEVKIITGHSVTSRLVHIRRLQLFNQLARKAWKRPPQGRDSCDEQPACRMQNTQRTSSWYMVENCVPGRPAFQHRRSLGLASCCRSPTVASSCSITKTRPVFLLPY